VTGSTSAPSQATSGADCWGQTIPSTGYDRYANLLTINVSKCSAPSLSLSVNDSNQVTNSGFSYDSSGDLKGNGVNTYTWDAEGRVLSGAGVTYTYDGDGRRVKKSSGTLYWYSVGGEVLSETDTSGNLLNHYVYFAGRRIGRVNSTEYLYYGDHLRSARAITDSSGHLCYDSDFYPFGGELNFTNTCAQNYKFTGMERDSETGLDHTLFRQYSSNLGRWYSPDPKAGCGGNPQGHNRYAYVLNSPVDLLDPSGAALICAITCTGECIKLGGLPAFWCEAICAELCAAALEIPIL
jgi:RHS repeat-associated protein